VATEEFSVSFGGSGKDRIGFLPAVEMTERRVEMTEGVVGMTDGIVGMTGGTVVIPRERGDRGILKAKISHVRSK